MLFLLLHSVVSMLYESERVGSYFLCLKKIIRETFYSFSIFQILFKTVYSNEMENFFVTNTGVDTARASSLVRSQKVVASPVTEAGTGHSATSSALKAPLVKTARKYVPPAKTVTTVTPFMASALTVTLAGLGTGRKTHNLASMFSYFVV